MGADSALNLGVRFQSSEAGTISGIRFWKDVNNTGTHVGTLYTDTGTQLAQATFSGESASGWQQVNFTAVSISANTTYVAAYHSINGHWSRSVSYFASSGYTNSPLSSPENGTNSEYNGQRLYSSSVAFPGAANGYGDNYWVDVVFNPGTGGNPPGVPTNLAGTAASVSQINLTWTASTGSPTGYYVYRNGAKVGSPSTNSYSDTGLAAATQYSYYVAAYNSYGTSGDSSTVYVTTQTPAAPTNLQGTPVSSSQINLTWNASSGATGYQVFRNGTQVGTPSTNSYSDTGLAASTQYSYYVTATANGAASGDSSTIYVTTLAAGSAPPVPTNLVATAASSSQINLTWNSSSGATGYQVFRLGVQVGTPSTNSYSDTGLSNSTEYSYWVTATSSGGTSAPSAMAYMTTNNSGSAPPAPTNLAGTAASSTSVVLTWTPQTDAAGVTSYNVYRNSTEVGTVSMSGYSLTTYTDTGLSANTQYSYYVVAEDANSVLSPNSSTIQVTTLASNSNAPPAPTNLQGRASSSTQIDLIWTPSVDSAGVTSYNVYRNSSKVGSAASTAYTDTGLAASTQYSYYVVAVDAGSRTSGNSSTIQVTTLSSTQGGLPTQLQNLFPLGADGQPVSPNNLSTWSSRGANTMIRIGGGQNYDVWNTTADTLGLKYIHGPANNPALDIGNANLLAWHQNDEPCSADPSSGLVSFFAGLKAIDITRPVSVNLAPGGMMGLGGCTAAQNQAYIVNASDWAMNDIYPIAGWDEPNDIIVPNNWVGEALQQMAGISQGRPQMQFVECSEQNLSWCPQCPAPTPAQFHTEFWDAIINGARGVFLFPEAISPFYWDNTTAAMDTQIEADWSTVTALTTALQTTINPSGMSATVSAPLEAGWRNSTHQYFIVNNTGASALNNQTVTLTGINGATTAVVYGESRNVNIVSGVITDNFAAESIHIYQVN
jgi:fibronectin type 3 domain-containing protein